MRSLLADKDTAKPLQADADGIYWDYDELAKSYVAQKRYGANVVLAWWNESRKQGTDERWERLDGILQGLASGGLPPHMGRLDGKVVVITGAGGGIGREAALLFSEEGASVCVADMSQEAGEQTASQAREAFFQQVDVADPASVEAMYAATAERYGGIDVLYNNAGIMPADDASILDTEPDAWQRVQDVNTKGVFLCCKYGIPHLLGRGGGSVINVASFVALVGAATSQISYTASKGAVLSLSRELAVEFARGGSGNALCPGPWKRRYSCACSPRRRERSSAGFSTCRWGDSPRRRRSRRVPSSSPATSPRT